MSVASFHAVPAQEVLTMFHSALNLGLDGLLGNPETRSDFLLRNRFDAAKNEYLTTAGGECLDTVRQEDNFLARAGGIGGSWPIINDRQRSQISYNIDRRHALSLHEVERDIPRHLEKKSLGGLDRLLAADPPNAKIRFLRDIFDIAHGRKCTAEISLELGVVRMHFLRKPTGFVGDRRRF